MSTLTGMLVAVRVVFCIKLQDFCESETTNINNEDNLPLCLIVDMDFYKQPSSRPLQINSHLDNYKYCRKYRRQTTTT